MKPIKSKTVNGKLVELFSKNGKFSLVVDGVVIREVYDASYASYLFDEEK